MPTPASCAAWPRPRPPSACCAATRRPPAAPTSSRRKTVPRASRLLGRRSRDARLNRRLADRQIDQRGERGERYVGVPHPLIAAGVRDRKAAQVSAEEAADLVRQQREAEERGEVADAEELADDSRGRRHGGEPGEAEPDREKVERQRRLGREEIDGDQHGARAVHPGEDVFAAIAAYAGAGEQAAGDVGDADERERPARDRRRQAAEG